MTKTPEELAYQKERDEMYYRERAVEHALNLQKQNKADHWPVETLVENANAIYCFYKGTEK